VCACVIHNKMHKIRQQTEPVTVVHRQRLKTSSHIQQLARQFTYLRQQNRHHWRHCHHGDDAESVADDVAGCCYCCCCCCPASYACSCSFVDQVMTYVVGVVEVVTFYLRPLYICNISTFDAVRNDAVIASNTC